MLTRCLSSVYDALKLVRGPGKPFEDHQLTQSNLRGTGTELTAEGKELARELRRQIIEKQHDAESCSEPEQGDGAAMVIAKMMKRGSGGYSAAGLSAYKDVCQFVRDFGLVVEEAFKPTQAESREDASALKQSAEDFQRHQEFHGIPASLSV